MKKVDTKALEGILDFLMKSKKPKKKDEQEVITVEVGGDDDEVTEDVLEDDFEELIETVSPRNKSKKGVMMSISQLGIRKPKVEPKEKPKRKRKKA